mmetsp:Transcript_13545/g.19877  ORF Transcript_13545/g.19877 Transcript_13545/m.19877 type:complete len:136 (-) Transcript_13545:1601-2008(-)
MFLCPGTATLEDGRIMITGGSGNTAVTFYDPSIDEWIRGPAMAIRRGYHAMTVLVGDGSVFTIGGSWVESRESAGNKYGELFRSGAWLAAGLPSLTFDRRLFRLTTMKVPIELTITCGCLRLQTGKPSTQALRSE